MGGGNLAYNLSGDKSGVAGYNLGASSTHSSSKPVDMLAIGGSYSGLSNVGTFKAKVGSNGVTSACIVREIAPKVNLTVSGSISGADVSTFKYGVGITM